MCSCCREVFEAVEVRQLVTIAAGMVISLDGTD